MEQFVTLFNKLFLPQGLTLHMSMERHIRNYVLWILCVDDETHNVLLKLSLPNVKLLKLSSLETKELISVKSQRTIAEYCWTLAPFAPRFVFEADESVNRVTYIDSDLWFLKSPIPIFNELEISKKKVLITDHAYSPEYDQSSEFGQFCVQFITFSRLNGEVVRKWWEERCIEWCFSYLDNGRFGDQKYLSDWPERFGSLVHILQDKETTLAPWNANRFPYANAIFYHFHDLRILSKKKLHIGAYSLPMVLKKYVYRPYSKDLKCAINMLESIQFRWLVQAVKPNILRRIYYKLRRLYRVVGLLIPSHYMKW